MNQLDGTLIMIGSFLVIIALFFAIAYIFSKHPSPEELQQEKDVKNSKYILYINGLYANYGNEYSITDGEITFQSLGFNGYPSFVVRKKTIKSNTYTITENNNYQTKGQGQ